ncbi:unnamed protein product [Allacma fusca]|uniref:Uncharacterized protein n=1 Tax=Allacma fusca TaxID=39272 RepID=A0A8J2KKE8_9HEXA|nr:unnamed protein product [Allacma fusca]
MCTSCGRRGAIYECNLTGCPKGLPLGRNIYDMIHDPCARRSWQCCKSSIYGKCHDGTPSNQWCSPVPPCCRFPPRRCPPPPPPPCNCNSCHRCNPNRACGFIVKPSLYPSGRPCCCSILDGCPCAGCCAPGAGGCCSGAGCRTASCPTCCPRCKCDCNPCNPRFVSNHCSRAPQGCPIPDPCLLPCHATCPVYCRPAWKLNSIKAHPYCSEPIPLPPRSFRYKCWTSQFDSKVDTNLCASLYSSRVDRHGRCDMVVVQPPDCCRCSSCPCHPCCSCC